MSTTDSIYSSDRPVSAKCLEDDCPKIGCAFLRETCIEVISDNVTKVKTEMQNEIDSLTEELVQRKTICQDLLASGGKVVTIYRENHEEVNKLREQVAELTQKLSECQERCQELEASKQNQKPSASTQKVGQVAIVAPFNKCQGQALEPGPLAPLSRPPTPAPAIGHHYEPVSPNNSPHIGHYYVPVSPIYSPPIDPYRPESPVYSLQLSPIPTYPSSNSSASFDAEDAMD